MLSLIILLVSGSLIAYFSLQNTMLVSVNFLDLNVTNIPLYYVIIGSMLVGLLLSYAIYIIHSISTSIKLHKKDKRIKENKGELAQLTKRIHQLELENLKLKKESGLEVIDENSL